MRDVSNIIEILCEEENSGKLISIIDSTKQKKAEQAIKHSLEFEKTISVISSRFIGSYDNDDAIDMSLSEIGNFTGASRVYLFLLCNNGAVMNNTHEWCDKGVIPQKDILQNIPTEASPWWIGKLRKGEVIHVEDVSKMPEEASFEKDMLEKQETKSLLVCPLKIGEKLNGFIGLNNVLDTGKWNYEDFAILRVCSEIIGNTLERRQTEGALRESEEKLRSFMDSTTDSFTLWDSGFNLIDVNKVGSEKFFPPGTKKEDVMGKNILDITPGLKETGRYDKYLEVLKTGKPFFADDVVPHPKFGDRYLSLKAFKVGDGLGMIVTDITELKKTEREIKQQNKISILRAEIWELAAQPLSEDELIQQLVDKVGPFFNLDSVNFMRIHPEEKAVVVEVQWQNGNKSGVGVNIPLWVLKRGVFGKPYFVASLKDLPLYARPIIAPFFKKYGIKSSLLVAFGDIDNPEGYIVASDTTDRDWSEEEINVFTEAVKIISLRAEKVKAEEKAKNHQIKIEQQNIKLRKLDQLKSEFLNITSHELRTPMTAMKGYIQMLLNQTLGGLTDEQQKALDVVLRNTNRLDRLVQDILDTSLLESGSMKFSLEKTDMNQLMKEIAETMQPSAEIKGITINLDMEEGIPELVIDQDRIKQVCNNLVNNAIKFSADGSVINVRAKKQEENVLVEIQDHGKGIPKDKQKKVFEMFYQVDSGMDRSFGGTGLGLSISRGIVLGHGGKILVESEKGKGSIFRFMLPIKPVQDVEGTLGKIDMFNVENRQGEI